MNRAHSLEELVEAGWAPSVRFLQKKLRNKQIQGKKVGRQWLMSDADVDAYLDSVSNEVAEPEEPTIGATSLRRVAS